MPRAEFGAVWAAAEDRTRPRDEGVSGWFTAGVAVTCRWLAGAVVESVPGRSRHDSPDVDAPRACAAT